MYKIIAWDFSKKYSMIPVVILEDDNLDSLKYFIRVSLKTILNDNFNKIPDNKLEKIINNSINKSFENIDDDIKFKNIDTYDILLILNNKLMKSLEYSLENINDLIKNIRLSSKQDIIKKYKIYDIVDTPIS